MKVCFFIKHLYFNFVLVCLSATHMYMSMFAAHDYLVRDGGQSSVSCLVLSYLCTDNAVTTIHFLQCNLILAIYVKSPFL